MRFINKFLGASARLILFMPLIILNAALIPLLFLDRLIQFRPYAAILELLRIPLKLLYLYYSLFKILHEGWSIGLYKLIRTFWPRLINFFHSEIFINPNLIFSTMKDLMHHINQHEGPLVGRLIRKIQSFFIPYESFQSYETHHESPQNPDSVCEINSIYNNLQNNYTKKLMQSKKIDQTISKFLQTRIENSKTSEEFRYAEAAKRCHRHFKLISGIHIRPTTNTVAIDLENKPEPIVVLYFVWTALEEESNSGTTEKLKEILASFMTQIQFGYDYSNNPADTTLNKNDQPECPTAAMAILVQVLKLLPDSKYKFQNQKLDIAQRLRKLLHAKLDSEYFTLDNRMRVRAPEVRGNMIQVERFKHTMQRPLKAYTHFLNETSQGKKLVNTFLLHANSSPLPEETVTAIANGVLEEWVVPPIKALSAHRGGI